MTFKQAIFQFKTEYQIICLANKINELNLGEEEILLYLSKAYAELSFNERLIEKTTTVRLVANQYEYTTGAGTDNIPAALIDIQQVRFNDGGVNMTLLKEISYENMPTAERPTGIPTGWTLHGVNSNRKLILDTKPDQTYSSSNNYLLTLYYREKIFIYSGTAENSFTGLDFTSATYGGSFANPTEWDDAIVMRAIAKVLPVNLKTAHLAECEMFEEKLRRAKPLAVESALPYYL